MMRSSRRAWLALGVALGMVGCAVLERGDWRHARRDSSGLAPSPEGTTDAVVQVYAARAVGWRAALAVHTWIVLKPRDGRAYTRYEVIGWGVERGLPAVRVNRMAPDSYWFGHRPTVLADRRGEEADALISRIEAAIATYPYPTSYRTWPGPNSNTFIAHIGRAVPELGLELPPTAIGKDFIPGGGVLAATPSGSGLQLSLLGVAGVLVGWEEGLEVNVLGLTFGVDIKDPALKVPGLGRLGVP